MTRRNALVHKYRTRRQTQRRLGDVVVRLRFQAFGKTLYFRFAGGGADQHAVATCTVHFFDHQLRQIRQHIRQLVGLAALPGLHVVQNRRFIQVKADHVGHIRVNGFVVRHACAQRVGYDHIALAVHRGQAGDANQRIRRKTQGIHVHIIHTPVNHIDLLWPFSGLHVHMAAAHKQVRTFDQLYAHLFGQKRMLEIRAIETPRRVQHDGGLLHPTGRAQSLQQQRRVMLDRTHRVAAEQIGKQAHHQQAVAQHVRHARRHAQVVFQHIKIAVRMPHDVHTGDVRVNLMR